FYRISRLAKPIANRNDHVNKSFGCSHDSPKKYSASNAYVIHTQKGITHGE
ncbi:inovirus Gp2 family protein, partial [Vibrio mimicus]